jgi:hypothetical protein
MCKLTELKSWSDVKVALEDYRVRSHYGHYFETQNKLMQVLQSLVKESYDLGWNDCKNVLDKLKRHEKLIDNE